MNIGLWGKPQTEEGWSQVWKLIGRLDERGPSLYGGPGLSEAFFQHQRNVPSPVSVGALYSTGNEQLPLMADLLVLWGGREELLHRLELISRYGPVVLLVGEGEGFPSIAEERLTEAVEQLLTGNSVIDSRMLLAAGFSNPNSENHRRNADESGLENGEDSSSAREDYVGAERVFFRRSDEDALLRVDLAVNGRPLASFEADGLTVSTPTGSAARSLPADGPFVVPGTDGLLVTPVASHTLTTRPILVPKSSTVEARVHSRSGRAVLRVDRSARPVESNESITIYSRNDNLRLIDATSERDDTPQETDYTSAPRRSNRSSEASGSVEMPGLELASTEHRLRGSFSVARWRGT